MKTEMVMEMNRREMERYEQVYRQVTSALVSSQCQGGTSLIPSPPEQDWFRSQSTRVGPASFPAHQGGTGFIPSPPGTIVVLCLRYHQLFLVDVGIV